MKTPAISPMLATLGRPPERFADFAVEAKYDGQPLSNLRPPERLPTRMPPNQFQKVGQLLPGTTRPFITIRQPRLLLLNAPAAAGLDAAIEPWTQRPQRRAHQLRRQCPGHLPHLTTHYAHQAGTPRESAAADPTHSPPHRSPASATRAAAAPRPAAADEPRSTPGGFSPSLERHRRR